MNSSQNNLATKREPNDCSVRALAVACQVPYKVAHRALQLEGRAPGWPTTTAAMMKAARHFGYALKTERVFDPPLLDSGLPWKGNCILIFTDHAAGMLDGYLIDNYYDAAGLLTAVLRPKRLKNAQWKIDQLMSDSFHLRLRLWYKRKIKQVLS